MKSGTDHYKQVATVILEIMWIIAIVPSAIFAPFAAFLFDDPAGSTSLFLIPFAILWFLAPVCYFIVSIITGVFLYKGKSEMAFRSALVPLGFIALQFFVGVLLFGLNL